MRASRHDVTVCNDYEGQLWMRRLFVIQGELTSTSTGFHLAPKGILRISTLRAAGQDLKMTACSRRLGELAFFFRLLGQSV